MSDYKIGDEIAFCRGQNNWEIRKIVGITPTGRINCDHGLKLRPDLTVMGGGSSMWSVSRAEPVTDEIRRLVWRRKCVNTLADVQWCKLTDEGLFSVLKILKGEQDGETKSEETASQRATDDG